MQRKLNASEAAKLIRPVSSAEIKKAMFSINGEKAPGPDWYNALFFQKNWELVGKDTIAAVKHFFASGRILREWNYAAISLIPKIQSPVTMKDYRPISCCTTLYKCISKILVERMKPVLLQLVSERQTAFVPGRAISDDVLLM